MKATHWRCTECHTLRLEGEVNVSPMASEDYGQGFCRPCRKATIMRRTRPRQS